MGFKCPQTQIQTQIGIQTQIQKLSCNPPGKVLTVNLGQYKMETMLEWYQGFISTKKISIQVFLVSWKIAFL